jgi:hypothetical protein
MDIIKTAEIDQVMRLAAKAKAEGVRLYVDRRDGRHYASSASTPGKMYFVTLASCTCVGFQHHGHCKHNAALQLATALATPDPTPVAMKITCAHVEGHYGLEDAPQWHEARTELLVDGDVKVRIIGDADGLTVHWIENGRPIDALTGCTPAFLRHGEVVEYWIRHLDARVNAAAVLRAAGIADPTEHRYQADEAHLVAA